MVDSVAPKLVALRHRPGAVRPGEMHQSGMPSTISPSAVPARHSTATAQSPHSHRTATAQPQHSHSAATAQSQRVHQACHRVASANQHPIRHGRHTEALPRGACGVPSMHGEYQACMGVPRARAGRNGTGNVAEIVGIKSKPGIHTGHSSGTPIASRTAVCRAPEDAQSQSPRFSISPITITQATKLGGVPSMHASYSPPCMLGTPLSH